MTAATTVAGMFLGGPRQAASGPDLLRIAEPFHGAILHEQYFWPFYPNYLPDHFPATRPRHPLADGTRL